MKKPHTRIRKAAKRTVKDSGDGWTEWLQDKNFNPVQTADGRRNLCGFKAAPVQVEEYRVPASNAEIAKSLSEVQKECLRLQETLDHLTNLADSLESNLGPVLRGIPLPSAPVSSDKEESPISPIGAQLRSFDTQARKIQETLSFILERLAV